MAKQSKSTVVPKLRFPDFQGEEGWSSHNLSDLTDVVRGGSPRPIDAYITVEPDGLNWLKIGDVPKDSKYITGTEQKVLKTALSKTREIVPGDFILSNSMSFGRPYLSKIRTCVHDGWIAVTSLPDSFSRDFLYYSMMSEASQTYFENQAAGGGVRNLTVDIVKLLPIGVPRPAEQQKIADCLTSLDEVIAAQGRKVGALKTYKRGLMQQLFPREGETLPRLRFPAFRDAPEWEVKPLSDVAENLDNKRVPITESERTKGDVPYYGASGVVDYVKDYLFNEDLLCVSEDGANLVARTYSIAFPITGKTWVNNHAHVLRFNDSATQKMVEDYLNSIDLRDFITGMAQPKLNRAMLDTIPVPLPEPGERRMIAECLSSLDASVTGESDRLDALRSHKRGLMQQLFPSWEEEA